jgi:predicted nucleotidyltransferase
MTVMDAMYSVSERSEILRRLVDRAESDPRIAGAALVGSTARDAEDRWSDIDLVLQLGPAAHEPTVVEDWTRAIDEFGIADTLDVFSRGTRYRVFFLRSSLQIDLSFWPHDRFRATEPAFRLLFGTPDAPTPPPTPDADGTIGMGWLHAIHARSAVARGRLWQATMMLDELRNGLTTLMCIRAGLNPWHGREVDQLPSEDLSRLETSRAQRIDAETLDRSRILMTRQFLDEVALHDRDRFERLRTPFAELVRTVR